FFVQRRPAIVDLNIAAPPSKLLESVPECGDEGLPFPVTLSKAHQHTDAAHPVRLLCTRRERPRRRGTNKRDELAPPPSITSAARARSVGGTLIPSALAVLRLTTSSSFVANCPGRSSGLSPLRIRPV